MDKPSAAKERHCWAVRNPLAALIRLIEPASLGSTRTTPGLVPLQLLMNATKPAALPCLHLQQIHLTLHLKTGASSPPPLRAAAPPQHHQREARLPSDSLHPPFISGAFCWPHSSVAVRSKEQKGCAPHLHRSGLKTCVQMVAIS